ncbi:MAG: Holliday junction resolvase [Anaerolineae bacterium]|jgi:predicted Holliday junction resolvase-like endonuclease|nr:Holliday junction resolvase [Anaerolineae bacterium]MBT7072992.1 Holliday junction resolvase [Anaerolineae bacterium]MBT7325272.1 Holliday junction resolvase [Anaerolineae bacterium]
MQTSTLILPTLFLIALAVIGVLLYILRQNKNAQKTLEREMQRRINSEYRLLFEGWKKEYEKTIRKDAASKSQSTLIGKITEHFIPYLPDFPYNPQDARFLGAPIDFIIFDGMSEGELKEIVLVEVKTNKGSLSKRERQLRDAVDDGKVKWIEVRRNVELESEK